MDMFYKVCMVVLIIGGLNWGLIGILNFDLIAFLFGGSASILSRIIYTLCGVSAICTIPALFSKNTGDGHMDIL